MSFELPIPRTTFDIALDDGAAIRMRRHGSPDGVRLLVTHGNGFAADAYYPYWQHLLAQYDVLVFDFRNHGQNLPAAPPHHSYEQFAADLERVLAGVNAHLGAKPTAGIFHSMSARTAMKHAIETGWHLDALVLFDPPNVPPPDHPAYAAMAAFEKRLTAWAGARRARFAEVAELTEEYRASRATARWVDGAHELMARSVLRKSPGGDGYALVCDPQNEANIYAQALSLNLWPKAAAFGGPVKLIGCDPDMDGAPATGRANAALGREGGYDYSFVPGTGHLLQIEKPRESIALTLAFLAERGLG